MHIPFYLLFFQYGSHYKRSPCGHTWLLPLPPCQPMGCSFTRGSGCTQEPSLSISPESTDQTLNPSPWSHGCQTSLPSTTAGTREKHPNLTQSRHLRRKVCEFSQPQVKRIAEACSLVPNTTYPAKLIPTGFPVILNVKGPPD